MHEFSFHRQLINWYKKFCRVLPWRENSDPYRIWLSEIMLQQTQVATVIDYFNRFIKSYPNVEALNQAKEEDVFKLWEGLGYYSRARNLIRCAKTIVEEYNGIFPKDINKLKKLPGIGPYTAGAIMSIAYNEPVPAIDGNVMRVISRYRMLDVNISDTKIRSIFEKEVMALMGGSPREFNQALMELGATICTPKQPKCSECPVKEGCKAFKNETTEQYPVKLKKLQKKVMKMAVIILEHQGKMMIVKRPNSGLMANLWGFPAIPYLPESPKSTVKQYMKDEFDLEVLVNEIKEGPRHIFTHLIWEMQIFKCNLKSTNEEINPIEFPEIQWVKQEQLKKYAFPTAFKKLFSNL
ncbi:MAG: A/G-specific adenine glycosylase [Epulopiscium sp.]|nr:A/G-specific adenine glycosylase [Candidatus Epulonipiscium sp.]